jgi:hypothetical protein
MAAENTELKPKTVVLNSWKEIAQYVGRGVRTVQRWESLGLPARRPHGKSRSAVLAISDELDAWLRICPARRLDSTSSKALTEVRDVMRQNAELRACCRRVREDHARTMAKLIANLKSMAQEAERNRSAGSVDSSSAVFAPPGTT